MQSKNNIENYKIKESNKRILSSNFQSILLKLQISSIAQLKSKLN